MTYPSAPEPTDAGDEPSAARNGLIIGGVALVLLLLVGGVYLVTRNKGVGPTLSSENTLPGTTAPPATGTTAPRSSTTKASAGDTTTTDAAPTVTSASGPPTSAGVPTTQVTTPTTKPPTTPPTTTATTSTTAKPKPTITSYSVPATVTSSACASQGYTEITISWDTTNAATVTISIDGPGPFKTGLPPKGSLDVPFSGCFQTVSHTYMITATAQDGTTTTQTKTATYTKP